jgi:hypothetical protein
VETQRLALRTVLVVGCSLAAAGCLCVFALLLTDLVLVVIHENTKPPSIDPRSVSPGIYLAGLFILSIGAGLLVPGLCNSTPPKTGQGNQGTP